MKVFELPTSLLVMLFTAGVSGAATGQQSSYSNATRTTLATTGSGSKYASACAAATSSYSSAYNSWNSAHQWVENQTQVIGGDSWSLVTYYENGTTLCDGHARVPQSPAVPLSSATVTCSSSVVTTEVEPLTYFSIYSAPSPTCSIQPADCDTLWQAYSLSFSAWQGANASATLRPPSGQITAAPQTPPCMNQSAASSYDAATSSIYGCGLCTIYGQGVELVYFLEPTKVSRDMCASTPHARETYYGDGAVIEAYAGTAYGRNASGSGKETAVVGQNTFTSGTAYISIATVYAQDRCSSTRGTPVYNAILAMNSQSVLSLRYSQDHFKWAMVTATQTGFPVSYADFNKPIPWSAWNGQAPCNNAFGGYYCDVIYEDDYTPQLAIPPEINQLNSEWSDCQLWYGGLYDPPLALQPAESIALPTAPGHRPASSTAQPSSTAAAPTVAPTVAPTALPDVNGNTQSASPIQTGTETTSSEYSELPAATRTTGRTEETSQSDRPVATPGGSAHVFTENGNVWTASVCGAYACIGTVTVTADQPAQTLPNGVIASYGSKGLVIQGSTTITAPSLTQDNEIPGPSRHPGGVIQTVVTIAAQPITIQRQDGGDGTVLVGSGTLVPGGTATTLPDGEVLSAGDGGLVAAWHSTILLDAASAGSGQPASPSGDFGGGTATEAPSTTESEAHSLGPTTAVVAADTSSGGSSDTDTEQSGTDARGAASNTAQAGRSSTDASGTARNTAQASPTSVVVQTTNRGGRVQIKLGALCAGVGLGFAVVALL
ncbi:hypothetical protein LTR85_007224 [Meristemomyces frigidus]|nr:hypothetical protein LTR85_007224 [Meristemomyces frigidus]